MKNKIRLGIASILFLLLMLACGPIPQAQAQVTLIPSLPPGQPTATLESNAPIQRFGGNQLSAYAIRVQTGSSFLVSIESPATNAASHNLRLSVLCVNDPQYAPPTFPLTHQFVRIPYRLSQAIMGNVNTAPSTYGDNQLLVVVTGSNQIGTGSALNCSMVIFTIDNVTTLNSDVLSITATFSPSLTPSGEQGGTEGGASSVTSPKGNTFTHINSATNTQIKSVAGTFHSITINTTAAGAVTIVDTSVANCTGGTTIAVFAASATIGTYTYDVGFTNGLCITTAAASDITVSAR